MKATITDGKADIATKPTPAILSLLPRLEGRKTWPKAGGLRIEATDHNLDVLKRNLPSFEVEAPAPADEFDAESVQRPLVYTMKTEPFPHQKEALEQLAGKQFFALFMEQGTGKSKVAIDWAVGLHNAGRIDAVLVVSKKGAHRQWIESQASEHAAGKWQGSFWPNLPPPNTEDLAFFAINYDGLKTKKGFAATESFCKRHRGRLLIVADESQEIKNTRSARYKAMWAIKNYASHRLLATGTPLAKDLTDEWAQINWLDPGIIGVKYITTFRSKYCIMGGFENREIVGTKNMEEFRSRVDPYTYRVRKDVIGIPPKLYDRWTFDLTKQQVEMIRDIRRDLVARIEGDEPVPIAHAAAAVTKAQQVSNGFLVDENGIVRHFMPIDKNPRVIAAREWYDATDDGAIIWCRFREDIRILKEYFSGITALGSCYGDNSVRENEASIDAFKSGDIPLLIANPQSAGTGLNLQGTCNRALYYSNGFSALDRWQSEDRIHRIGTTGSVVLTDLYAIKGVDGGILSNLKKKRGLSDMAIEDVQAMFDD